MIGQISIIIPVYNQAREINRCISSIKNQTFPFKNIEVILINNASDDESVEICRRYERKYKNILFLNVDRRGVSFARNAGIKKANGKYIFFLDADDLVSPNTIRDCVDVFDSVYNEIDLLTYPIETHYKGRILPPHFRYRYLKENGVYDLTKEAFIGQTTMNVVVKNKFDYNVLFDENMEFSEDQKYCCDVTRDKLKMGFCKTAKYIYNRSEEGASGRLSGACYIFESSLKMFEDIFSNYEHVPVAYQGLFINDVYWKMISNIFFPYHYSFEKYNESIARVKALMRKCYNYVILDHPGFDYYEKFYLLKLKGDDSVSIEQKKDEIAMYSEGYDIFRRKDLEMVVTNLMIEGDTVRIFGFLKSVFFQFYLGSVELYAVENGSNKRLMELHPSVHNYYRSHEATQRFYATEYVCDINSVSDMRFELKLGNTILPVGFYIMPLVPFSKTEHTYTKDGVEITLQNRKWTFGKCEEPSGNTIWLYYDCAGVACDNGMRQFVHDCKYDDGIIRYYVVSDKSQIAELPRNSKTVTFGSSKHKRLLQEADKVITAFIEENNIFPWSMKEIGDYANSFRFDTIYLQHGVLHIDMPWKYSPEKIIADKVVVSSDVDYSLFRDNGYDDNDLWKTGMPRFDFISDSHRGEKRILFAPSWRSYLVSSDNESGWKILDNKFFSSKYYNGIKSLLESENLKDVLENNGYILDIKMHPIFMKQDLKIDVPDEVIHFVTDVNVEDYGLFITDFSSFMFDFLYINTPVLSYIPDHDEFLCGMNGYRKVDFMDKVDENEISKTPEALVDSIEKFIMTGKGLSYSPKFFNTTASNMDEIYRLTMELG